MTEHHDPRPLVARRATAPADTGSAGKPDHLTSAGAVDLAERIADHWRIRGHDVAMRVEPIEGSDSLFAVRSDLLAGLPRPAR